jgi:hypothetical protein
VNLSTSAVVLRERSVLETADLAVRFVVALCPRAALRLAALTLVPSGALSLALYAWGASAWVLWLVALVSAGLAQGPFIVLASQRMFEVEVTAGRALAQYARSFGRHLVTRLAAWLLVLGGIGTFVVPGWFFFRSFAHVDAVTLLENAGPQAAFPRSKRMSTQDRSLGAAVCATLGVGVGVLLAETCGQFLVAELLDLGTPFGTLFENGITPFALAGLFASAPFVGVLKFLSYVDARTQRDGWDIQVRFLALAASEGRQHPGRPQP